MRLPRLHLDAELAVGHTFPLPRDRAHYLIHVLRLGHGARLMVFDGRHALDYKAHLLKQGKDASVHIESAVENTLESPLDSLLIQALGRPDRVDWLVQKATELGLRRLLLFNAEHSQTPLRGQRLERKLAHWRAVAASACEQCGRSFVPVIEFHPDLERSLTMAAEGFRALLDFNGFSLTSILGKSAQTPTGASFLIGPEGGLAPAEIRMAHEAGFLSWRLGPRVLRMETAAVSALALLQERLGDLSHHSSATEHIHDRSS